MRAGGWKYTNVVIWVGLSPDVPVDTRVGAVGAVDPAAGGGGIVCGGLASSRRGDADYVARIGLSPNIALRALGVSAFVPARERRRNGRKRKEGLPLIQVSGP